ncbi:hypothetical protein SLA2020_392330 [Shorea laevis]
MTNLISATHDPILFLVDSYTQQNSSFLSPYALPPIPNPPLPPLRNRNPPIQNTQQTRTPSRPASPRYVSAAALEPERKPSSGSPRNPDPPPDPSPPSWWHHVLPPVPLKEPMSGGLKVDFGFSPYSERINGRIAILGLTALLLVELATGNGVRA